MDGESTKPGTPTDSTHKASAPEATEPLLFRYQFLLRSRDQTAVAFLLVISFLGAVFFFAHKAYRERGFVDIDRVQPSSAQYLVDINSAEWPEIANLPGIGPKLANAIVDFRAENGRYHNHDQLIEVSGIGPAKLENLRQFLAPIGQIDTE